MIAVLDVACRDQVAVVGMVLFRDWDSAIPSYTGRFLCTTPAAYIPGAFYRRDLPCLIKALASTKHDYTHVLIDGYVHLRDQARKGSGRHLYEHLADSATVIGVAKNPLVVAEDYIQVCRGRSRKPLFISAVGMDTVAAAECIVRMAGGSRILTMIKLADRLSRQELPGNNSG